MGSIANTSKPSLLVHGTRLALLVLLIALFGNGRVLAGVPCEQAGAPACGGDCPAGQRCIASPEAFQSITITVSVECLQTEPVQREESAANGECECAEVLCGGVPLEQNQGCCNGRPFTLGTQGCCHGVVLASNEPCTCQTVGIDLATLGCCGEQDAEQRYDPAVSTCCQRSVTQPGCEGKLSTISTYNFGFDCCPGPAAAESEFCDGQCMGSECASTGCCQCQGCFDGPACAPGGPTTVAGLGISCIVGCFAQACTDVSLTQQETGMCTEDGFCVAPAAAPAVSHRGLFFIAVFLVAAGCVALARRQRRAAS